MLSAVGVRAVGGLDTDGASLASEAERWLDRELLRIQSQGWHYNIRYDVDLAPDGDGYIIPGTDTIWIDSDRDDSGTDVALVGGKLYNKDENTFVFDETITVRDCRLFDFACIPHPVRDYILKSAAHRFARAVKRELRLDPAAMADIESDLLLAQTAAHQFDNDSSNDNVLETVEGMRLRGNYGAVVR